MSNTTMARVRNISTADELRSRVAAMIVADWISVPAIAFAVSVSSEDLTRWLAGKPIKGDSAQLEKEIEAFLESRAAWLAEVKDAAADRRRELRLIKAQEVRDLGAKLAEEPRRSVYGDMLQDAIAFGIYDLFLLSEEDEAACWRCGSPRNGPAPTTVEEQIELNLRTAVWRGFKTEESFRERMRAVMSDGEYIMHIHGGVVWVRRPNRSVYVLLAGGEVQEASS